MRLKYEYAPLNPKSLRKIEFELNIPAPNRSPSALLAIVQLDNPGKDMVSVTTDTTHAGCAELVEGLIALGRVLEREWQPRNRRTCREEMARGE